jgi:hypothetical protein
MMGVHSSQGVAWTDERVERLKELQADGLSCSLIADELGGITRNAVIGKLYRLGLAGHGQPTRTARGPRMLRLTRAPRLPRAARAGGPQLPRRHRLINNMVSRADTSELDTFRVPRRPRPLTILDRAFRDAPPPVDITPLRVAFLATGGAALPLAARRSAQARLRLLRPRSRDAFRHDRAGPAHALLRLPSSTLVSAGCLTWCMT